MPSSRTWMLVLITSGGLAAGGVVAIGQAPGAPATSLTAASSAGKAGLEGQVQQLALEEAALQQAIKAAQARLTATIAEERTKVSSTDALIAKERESIAAEQRTLEREAAQLAARSSAPTVHAVTRASGSGDDGGGGGDN
ncbi:MAG: hypothetical protein ACYCO3_03635 [Mycobacteriales bacterium]